MNKQYIKWLLKQHKFLFIMEFICAFLFIFLMPLNEASQVNQFLNYGYSIVAVLIMNALYLVFSGFAYVLIINTKLYKKNSMDVYAALPMSKTKLILHEYGVGMIIVLLPYVISVISLLIAMNVIFSMNNNLYYDVVGTLNTYYLGFAHSILIFIVMYSILYVLTMKAKSMFDAVIFTIGTYGCMMFTWVAVYQMLVQIQIGNIYELGDQLNNIADLQFVGLNIAAHIMNPLYSLFNVFEIFNESNSITTVTIITIVIEIVVFVLTLMYLIYYSKVRINEDIQGVNHSKLGYPLTICVFISGLAIFFASEYSASSIPLWAFIILFSFFIYMVLLTCYNRKFVFKLKYVVVFVCLYVIAYTSRYAYIQSDGLGSYTTYRNYDYEIITIGYFDGYGFQEIEYNVDYQEKESVTLFLDECKDYTKEYYLDQSKQTTYVSVELKNSYNDIQRYTFYMLDEYGIDTLEDLIVKYIELD